MGDLIGCLCDCTGGPEATGPLNVMTSYLALCDEGLALSVPAHYIMSSRVLLPFQSLIALQSMLANGACRASVSV